MENHPWKSPASIEAENKWKELQEDFEEVNKSKQIYEKEKEFFGKILPNYPLWQWDKRRA